MFRLTVLLCAIAVQVLSAPNPNGCIKLYRIYHSQRIPESLAQQEPAGSNKLDQQPVDYTRPENWTEQNDYRTDGGAGTITKEEGQIVTVPGRFQYYQKHPFSSPGVNTDKVRSPNYSDVDESILTSQSTIGSASGLERVGHWSASLNSANDPQVRQRRQSPTASNGGNWHTSNSWKTDGGRGVVHEEQGQVVDGSARIQYYHKNYSSSYNPDSAGPGVVSMIQHSLKMTVHRSTVGQTSHGTSGVDEGHLRANGNESTNDQDREPSHNGTVAKPNSNLNKNDIQHTSRNSGFNQQQRPHQPPSGHREFNQHTENDENREPSHNGTVATPSSNLNEDDIRHTSGNPGFNQQQRPHQPPSGHREFNQNTENDENREPSHNGTVATPSSNLNEDDIRHTSGNSGFNQQQRSHQPPSGHREFNQNRENDENREPSHNGTVAKPNSNLNKNDIQYTSGKPGFNQQQPPHQPPSGHREFNQNTENDENRMRGTSGSGNYPQETSDNLPNGQEKHQPGMTEIRPEATPAIPSYPKDTGVKGQNPRKPAPELTQKHTQRHPHSNIEADKPHINNLESNFENVDHPKNTENEEQENVMPQSFGEQDNPVVLETKPSKQHSLDQGEDHSEPKLNLVIAYGGNRGNNAKDKEDIGKANVNPSATFAPNPNDSKESWNVIVNPIKKFTERPIETPEQELDSSITRYSTDVPEVTTTKPSGFFHWIKKKTNIAITKIKDKLEYISGKL